MRILSERLALPRRPSLTWYKAGSGDGLDLTRRLLFTSGRPWAYPASHETVVSVSDHCAAWLVVLVCLVGMNFSIHFAGIWSRDYQPKNTQRDVGKIPKGNAVPKEVLRLGHKHQLRPLAEREEGTKIEELPNGIYGFSMCRVVALRATRGNTFSLEIQKHDGIIFYVGYASDEEIEQYLTRQKNFHIITSPHPRKGASSLFDIPVEFVSKCEERPVGDGYLFDLFVTAIPECKPKAV